MTRRAHLEQLAAEVGANLALDERPHPDFGVSGYTFPNGNVTIHGWDAGKHAYIIGLHELGHVALRHLPNQYHNRRLDAEAEAWQWAFDHAREKVGRVLRRIIRDQWLGSYVRHHDPRFDNNPSAPFFAVANALRMTVPPEMNS